MPHKPAPKQANAMPAFVSSSLTTELKPALKSFADRNEAEVMDHISEALYAGYAFSCKAEDVGFQAALRASETVKNTANHGKVLVERAGTPLRAVLRLFWAHEELFEKSWPGGVRSIDDDW